MEELTLSELQIIEFALQALSSHPEAQELRKKFAETIRARTKGGHALQAADFIAPTPSHT